MDRFESTIDLINIDPSLPSRRGKRPITIGRPIQVQCGDHGDGAIVRGWAEPHLSSGFGLVPPGVMVVYTPRDEYEVAVCRSLFWVSYNFSLREEKEIPRNGALEAGAMLQPISTLQKLA